MKELFSTNVGKIIAGVVLMILSAIIPVFSSLIYIAGVVLLGWGLYPIVVDLINKYIPAKYKTVVWIAVALLALICIF